MGDMDVALGEATIINGVPETDVIAPGALKVSCTDDPTVAVPVLIPTFTCVELMYVHVAAMPELGTAPTLATHVPEIKSVPITVMVLPM